MTLEEKFAEMFPEYTVGTVGSVFLSPYWDLFEAGAEIATKELQEDLKHKKIAIQKRKARIKDLEKENATLKKEYSDNLSLKDEELMCLETEFNTYKSGAKEHIENLLYYIKQCTCERSNYTEIEKDIKQAEAFLKE